MRYAQQQIEAIFYAAAILAREGNLCAILLLVTYEEYLIRV